MGGGSSSSHEQTEKSTNLLGSTGKDTIKIHSMNAQSIVNKLDILRVHVSEYKPDILVITESWTHDKVTEGILKIENYELFGRCDRKDTLKAIGGVRGHFCK